MAPTIAAKSGSNGLDVVRERLLTAMHLGKLRPGDRVLSVRRLSDMTGLNRKTVHRAYRTLEREGFLDVRPGSGTYVSEHSAERTGRGDQQLLSAVNHFRAEATTVGLDPDVFARFLMYCTSGALRGLPVAVAECNGEQIGIIARELHESLGLAPRPLSLRDLAMGAPSILSRVAGIVTTDCHVAEVSEHAARTRLPVYRLALDSDFPKMILHAARRESVVMVVRDAGFGPVFVRLLRHLGAAPAILDRLRIVEPTQLSQELRRSSVPPVVHVSDLVDPDVVELQIAGLARLTGRWRVAVADLESLRALLARDRALRETGGD